MNILVDTHLLLWSAGAPHRLSAQAMSRLSDRSATLHFSVASIWEVAIKHALGKPTFRADPGQLRAGLLASCYIELPVKGPHVLGLSTLPHHHNDPFDRLLICQAAAEGMQLLTSDAQLGAYRGPVVTV